VRGLLAVTESTALFFHPLLRDLLVRRFKEIAGETPEPPRQVPPPLMTKPFGTRRSRSGSTVQDGEFMRTPSPSPSTTCWWRANEQP
jgi:hypothetical protein